MSENGCFFKSTSIFRFFLTPQRGGGGGGTFSTRSGWCLARPPLPRSLPLNYAAKVTSALAAGVKVQNLAWFVFDQGLSENEEVEHLMVLQQVHPPSPRAIPPPPIPCRSGCRTSGKVLKKAVWSQPDNRHHQQNAMFLGIILFTNQIPFYLNFMKITHFRKCEPLPLWHLFLIPLKSKSLFKGTYTPLKGSHGGGQMDRRWSHVGWG